MDGEPGTVEEVAGDPSSLYRLVMVAHASWVGQEVIVEDNSQADRLQAAVECEHAAPKATGLVVESERCELIASGLGCP